MSFDWNLSSDEENGFDDWANVDLQESLKQPSRKYLENSEGDDDDSSEDRDQNKNGIATVAFLPEDTLDEEEDDEVDWEDAEEDDMEEGVHGDSKLPADNKNAMHNLKPVTLDMSETPKDTTKTKRSKRMARRTYRFENLPPDLQRFLSNLEKTHLLSLTSHAMHASKYCSGDEPLHIAHSLIPSAWMKQASGDSAVCAPTEQDLSNFCHFFFNLVNRRRQALPRRKWKTGKRKNASSAKSKVDSSKIYYRTEEYCSYLSRILDEDPQRPDNSEGTDFNAYDKIQLFISMTRSLGWRARYVMAIEPTKKDLDPSHPLFVAMSTRNVFQRVWREKAKKDGGGKKPAKRARTTNKETGTGNATLPLTLFGATSMARPISWIEILCQSSDRKQAHQIKKKLDVKPEMHWIHVDPRYELVNQPDLVEAVVYAERQGIPFKKVKKKVPIPYVLAAEHISVSDNLRTRLTDVTPRYASSWTESLKMRGILRGKQRKVKDSERVDKWWTETLKFVNSGDRSRMAKLCSKGKSVTDAIVLDDASIDDDKPAADTHIEEVDDHEEEELKASAKDEPLPTSKTAFKSHPVYVIPSVLNQNEVLVPDANKRICGFFKGEAVFRRSDVRCAVSAKRWLYKGRKVKGGELSNPIRRVNIRKTSTKGFKALKSYGIGDGNDGSEEAHAKQLAAASKPLDDDDKEDLYAPWQTDPWSPTSVGPNDPIPVNEYNNIELELLNPGLVHIVEHRIAVAAKQLGIPYAPCLLGFEGHRGNRTPTIRGIVVHEHNAELLREANVEMASMLLEQSHESRQQAVYQKWKRLLVGVLTKDRLDKAYGGDDS